MARMLRELSGLQRLRRPDRAESVPKDPHDPSRAPEDGLEPSRGVYRPKEVKVTPRARLGQSKKHHMTSMNSYRIHSQVGSGSFGQVYRATRANETFAIKIMQRAKGSPPLLRKGCTDSTASNGSMLQRPCVRPGLGAAPDVARGLSHGRAGQVADIEREIAVMQRLHHPNITQLFEVIDDVMASQVFFVMEFVAGTTLAQPIYDREAVPEADLRHWLREVILGLEHMHLHEVAHRDVKPDNILWDPVSRHAKLTDFGTALVLRQAPGRLGHSYVRPRGGTPAFYTPEMCATEAVQRVGGASAYDADWWAFGVCLYMWLHHVNPFEAPTPMLSMQRIREGVLDFPEDCAGSPGVSADAHALLHALLQQLPSHRLRPSAIRHHRFVTASGTLPIDDARKARNAPDERKELAVYELRRGVRSVAAQLMATRGNHDDGNAPSDERRSDGRSSHGGRSRASTGTRSLRCSRASSSTDRERGSPYGSRGSSKQGTHGSERGSGRCSTVSIASLVAGQPAWSDGVDLDPHRPWEPNPKGEGCAPTFRVGTSAEARILSEVTVSAAASARVWPNSKRARAWWPWTWLPLPPTAPVGQSDVQRKGQDSSPWASLGRCCAGIGARG